MDKKSYMPLLDHIDQATHRAQRAYINAFSGREKEGLISIFRTIDCLTIIDFLGPNKNSQDRDPIGTKFLAMGIPSATKPFLELMANDTQGVPWGPGNSKIFQFTYAYLKQCSSLAFLRRMAKLERIGLAEVEETEKNYYSIRLMKGPAEEALLSIIASRQALNKSPRKFNKIERRMRSYVETEKEWFIRYNNDDEIVDYYFNYANSLSPLYLETEALPDEHVIGDRSFREWKNACVQAHGRVLCHIKFCSLLLDKNPKISLADICTIFSRREDIESIWMESGLPKSFVPPTLAALTLEFGNVNDWDISMEVPTPYYVDFGKDFLLLPCFGALLNPYFALFRHLRKCYRSDWDKGVDKRESIFRSDLANLFLGPRFNVPGNGFKLKREDGSTITDIDAVIVDNESGDIALIQLKWNDVFGLSLSERESKRKNILKANEWVQQVHTWVHGCTCEEIAKKLNIKTKRSENPPMLWVVARYAARFTERQQQDERASWISWLEIQKAVSVLRDQPFFLKNIPKAIFLYQDLFEKTQEKSIEFDFPEFRSILVYHVTST